MFLNGLLNGSVYHLLEMIQYAISMTGLSNQSKYTKGAKTSNDRWGVI